MKSAGKVIFSRALAVLCAMLFTSAAVAATTVTIDPTLHNYGHPLSVQLTAGIYFVEQIGIVDGAPADSWTPFAAPFGTPCTNANGCPATSPTTVSGWTNAYAVISSNISSVQVEGVNLTPVGSEPSFPFGNHFLVSPGATRYVVFDTLYYPTAADALNHSQDSAFVLSASGMVGFAIIDESNLADNRGSITLRLTSTTFFDVTPNNPFFTWIEALAEAGITRGCATNPALYCPESQVTREQMAVFLLRAIHGLGYTPPPASGIFADVPANDLFAPWIEQLSAEGITGGCGTNPPRYCPDDTVTREQIAVFLLRSKHGATYQPPPASGIFADVPANDLFAPWIEQLSAEGITGGCGTNPPRYCPDDAVTREQMAVFLVRTFNLPL